MIGGKIIYFGEIIIAISFLAGIGIVLVMVMKRLVPEKNHEENAEVIKKYEFIDQNYKENGVRVSKTLYSISFLINGKKKSFYCKEGFYDSVEAGDKVKIVHNRGRIIDLNHMKE